MAEQAVPCDVHFYGETNMLVSWCGCGRARAFDGTTERDQAMMYVNGHNCPVKNAKLYLWTVLATTDANRYRMAMISAHEIRQWTWANQNLELARLCGREADELARRVWGFFAGLKWDLA